MRRFTVPFLVVAVLLMSVVAVGVRPNVVAQDATPAGMRLGDHPLVGAWRINNPPEDPIPYTYAIFHDDGTYLEVTVGVGTGVGVWQPTGERTADVTAFFQDIDSDIPVIDPGTITARSAIEVDQSGMAATATYAVEIRSPDDTLEFEAGPLARTLTRLEVEPLEAGIGAAAAGTPTP